MSSIGRSIAGLVAALALGTGHATPLAPAAAPASVIDARSTASTELHTQSTRVWINVRGLELHFDIGDDFASREGKTEFSNFDDNAELSAPNLAGEPGSLVLLGLGLVALALIRRRRSRK